MFWYNNLNKYFITVIALCQNVMVQCEWLDLNFITSKAHNIGIKNSNENLIEKKWIKIISFNEYKVNYDHFIIVNVNVKCKCIN